MKNNFQTKPIRNRITPLLIMIFIICLLYAACEDEYEGISTSPDARQLADDAIEYMPEGFLHWEWTQATYMHGINELYKETIDIKYRDYVQDFVDSHIDDIIDGTIDFNSSDKVSPAAIAVDLLNYGCTGYESILVSVDAYLEENANRTSGGAITHVNYLESVNDQTWIDSLFMFGMYWMSLYQYTDSSKYLEDYAEQYLAFAGHHRSSETGLFYHMYDDSEGTTTPSDPVFWLRGNGWTVAATAKFLSLADETIENYNEVYNIFKIQLDTILSYQADDGLFYTVINYPGEDDNYTETSGSALIGYALSLGIKAGFLDGTYKSILYNIVNGIKARLVVNTDGYLTTSGTSSLTNPGDYANYTSVPQETINVVDFATQIGIGTVLMCLSNANGI